MVDNITPPPVRVSQSESREAARCLSAAMDHPHGGKVSVAVVYIKSTSLLSHDFPYLTFRLNKSALI